MFKTPLYLLKKSNLDQLDQLSIEDQTLIKNILQRMSLFKINSIEAQIIHRDLLGMAIEHKRRGSSLTAELGADASRFADEVYKSAGHTNWLELLLSLLLRISGYFFIWFLMSSLLLYGGFTWSGSTLIYPLYMVLILISFAIDLFITPHFIMQKSTLRYMPQGIALVAILVVAANFTRLAPEINTQTIHAIPILLLTGTLFLIAQLAQNILFKKMAAVERHHIEDLK